MTPDELRSLADEATPGPWFAQAPIATDDHTARWEVGTDDDLICEIDFRTLLDFDKRDEMTARLIALAPDLARLSADLGEALENATAFRSSAALHRKDAVLAKLSELKT